MTTSDPLHTTGGLTATFGNLNGAESFGGVASPLGWTFFETAGEIGMRQGWADIGALSRAEAAPPEDRNLRFLNPFYGRPGSNITLLRSAADRLWGSSGDAFDAAYFAGERDASTAGRARQRIPLTSKVKFIVYGFIARVQVPRYRTAVERWWQASVRPGSTSSSDEARATYREASGYFRRIVRRHAAVSWVSQALLERLKVRCVAAGSPGLELELISSDEGFEEQGLIADLWAVSRGQRSLDEFLAVWGFHGRAEGELSSRTWREDPAPLKPIIDAYRAKPDDEVPTSIKGRQVITRHDAEQKILGELPFLDKVQIRLLLRAARSFIPLRQVGRGTFLMAQDVARCMARRIGDQMARDGVLADPDDVFYLTESELLGRLPDDVGSVIRSRRERRDYYKTIDLPERWTGELTEDMVLSLAEERDDVESSGDPDRIEGLGVSAGVAEGRAIVLTEPDAAYELEAGDILVCVTTDPSWSAIFFAVDAVVTDIGAEMSHGAIVARELGLPAVVNTRGASKRLHTGDRIRVDGTNGVVEVLERVAQGSTERGER